MTWVLWIALASAGDIAVEPESGSEVIQEAEEELVELPPWELYRLRPVLHPTIDVVFLETWEPAFVRRNRLAGVGAGIAAGGLIAAFAGGATVWTGQAGPAALLGAGIVGALAGPTVGIVGNFGAARILRASGVHVSRAWGYTAIICFSASALGLPAIITYPISIAATLVQSQTNQQAFVRVMGHTPGRSRRLTAQVVPRPSKNGAGLALVGTW